MMNSPLPLAKLYSACRINNLAPVSLNVKWVNSRLGRSFCGRQVVNVKLSPVRPKILTFAFGTVVLGMTAVVSS